MSEAAGAVQPKKGGRKLILLVLVPLVLLLCGAGAAIFLGMVPSPFAGAEAAPDETAEEPPEDPLQVVFVDLPDILVNLNLSAPRLRFLKFVAALEVRHQEDAALIERFMPRISDNFHAYLRALQTEELDGPEAVYRVKRDLLARVNQVVRPVQVRDVLIKEMLVQ